MSTFTVRGQRVRSESMRRYIVVRLDRRFVDGRYGDFHRAEVQKRSDSTRTLRTWIDRQGFHQSRLFVVVDTTNGEEVGA